ncbi:MAG: hypothetical protein WBW33_23275 [Bryobacteraceae bacterium]
MRAVCYLVLGLFALSSARAQTSQPGFGVGNLAQGAETGIIVGIVVVAVAGLGITYYALNKGVAEGCVAEADAGRRPIAARGRPREAEGP